MNSGVSPSSIFFRVHNRSREPIVLDFVFVRIPYYQPPSIKLKLVGFEGDWKDIDVEGVNEILGQQGFQISNIFCPNKKTRISFNASKDGKSHAIR